MNRWIWLMAYEKGEAYVVLADRDAVGDIFEVIGVAALELSARSWPWRLGLGALLHRAAETLLSVVERHTHIFAEIPADADLLDTLKRFGLIGEGAPYAPESAGGER